MKILWITNILFPDVCVKKEIETPVIGGWMYSSAKSLLETAGGKISLAVATTYRGNKIEKYYINNITYYLLPTNTVISKYNSRLEKYWKEVETDFKPDIVHIHGTEFAHGLAFLRSCKSVKSVVSIQGMISICARYYSSGLSFKNILQNITLRDIIRKDTIWQSKKNFIQRGRDYEREIIQSVGHIIGRTSWDKSHSWAINPDARYHFCNETLRDEFYKHVWNYDTCEKHSIFLSQASYPVKGLHQLIKALPIILKNYPDTKVYISGKDFTKINSFKDKLLRNGYSKLIVNLINKYKLQNNIIFLGPLNEQEMCERYLKSNVFVCPSTIENSPNSLGEAQLLGVPCIASYVGGVMDMMVGAEEWMYRFEEFEMLAMKVCNLFACNNYPSKVMRETALKRHCSKSNSETLLKIYQEII